MRVRRFLWVLSPRGKKHIKYGNTSEGPAKCRVFVSKGWPILNPNNRLHYPTCHHCARPRL